MKGIMETYTSVQGTIMREYEYTEGNRNTKEEILVSDGEADYVLAQLRVDGETIAQRIVAKDYDYNVDESIMYMFN